MSAQKGEEEYDLVQKIGANNNGFVSPMGTHQNFLSEMFKIEPEMANEILKQNGGDVNKAANFLTQVQSPVHAAPAHAPPPVQQATTSPSPRQVR